MKKVKVEREKELNAKFKDDGESEESEAREGNFDGAILKQLQNMKPAAPKQPKKINEKDNQMSKDMMESLFKELEEDKPTNGNHKSAKVEQSSRNFSDLRIEDELTMKEAPSHNLPATMNADFDDELEALEAEFQQENKNASKSANDGKMDIEKPAKFVSSSKP